MTTEQPVVTDCMINAVRAFVPAPCSREAAIRAAAAVLSAAADTRPPVAEQLTAPTPILTAPHVARRGSDVEAWIKRERDRFGGPGAHQRDASSWYVLDALLNEYRDHADTSTPLDREVQGPGEES